jgi:hypothetical protein
MAASGYRYLFLAESRHYSVGFTFALAAWAAAASAAIYLLNAFFGERVERKYTQLAGAILFAGGWWGVYAVHNTPALVTFFIVATVGTTLWQFSMWVYIPSNYPTRMRSPGTGWTDGVGHVGAWGGVLLSGVVFTAAALGLDLADHDTGRAHSRLHGRDLRETPAPPHARRAGPIDTGPPGLIGRRPQRL